MSWVGMSAFQLRLPCDMHSHVLPTLLCCTLLSSCVNRSWPLLHSVLGHVSSFGGMRESSWKKSLLLCCPFLVVCAFLEEREEDMMMTGTATGTGWKTAMPCHHNASIAAASPVCLQHSCLPEKHVTPSNNITLFVNRNSETGASSIPQIL